MSMEPEDARLFILDLDDVYTTAFTMQGIDNLKELLADLDPKAQPA